MGQRRLAVGGWRSAALEVGGKGKIIANFGFRIANLKARSQESEDKGHLYDLNEFRGVERLNVLNALNVSR